MAWRNLGRNRRRSTITASAVAFALFFAISLRSLQLGIHEHMIDTIIGGVSGYIQVSDSSYWPAQNIDLAIPENTRWFDKLENDDRVKSVRPRLSGFNLLSYKNESSVAQWIGVDFEKEDTAFWNNKLITGSFKDRKSKIIPVWLGRKLAFLLNVNIGDTIVGLGQGYQGGLANDLLLVAGTLKLGNPELEKRAAILKLKDAQEYSGAYGMWGSVLITPKDKKNSLNLTSALSLDHKLKGASWSSWEERVPELKQAIRADSTGGIVTLFILYIVISFGLLGTMIMLANERQREFTMQIALGVKRRILTRVVLIEALLMGLLGSIIGITLGRSLAYFLHLNPPRLLGDAALAMENMGWEPVLPPSLDWSIAITHTSIVLFIVLFVSFWPVFVVYKSPAINR
ncbi:MAG: ABC transporter permease YtrF [Owenweeksia sp. TMED14]|nr:MAG: ABC transporter permease YtrF [Owenweeksia sp. TMED14]